MPSTTLGSPAFGQARQRHGGGLAEVAQRLVHLDRPGRAVEAEHVDAERAERRDRRADLGAGEHPTGQLDRHLGLDRHDATVSDHGAMTGRDRGLAREQVVDRLDDQQVDAAVEEPERHLLVTGREVVVGDLAERRELRARSHRSGDESRRTGAGVGVGDAARDLGRHQREFVGALGDAVLGEHDREGAEGVGLDDVGADVQERSVQCLDGVGLGDDEDLVAALERRAAEVVGVQILELEVRARRAVVDEDAFAQRAEVRVVRARSSEGRTRGGLH